MAVTLEMTANEFVELVTRAAEAAQGETQREEAEARREAGWAAFSVWEAYDPAKTYLPLNKVLYAGSTYVCLRETTGDAPSADSPAWLLCAARGEQGPPGERYTLPVAVPDALGGVQPVEKTAEMVQAVGVDPAGKLWALPGGSSYTAGPGITIDGDAISIKVSTAEGNALSLVDGALYAAASPTVGPILNISTSTATPGLEVTARQGKASVTGITDEAGNVSLQVSALGNWEISTTVDAETFIEQIEIPQAYAAKLDTSPGPGELIYTGTVTPLSLARSYLAATTIGKYALFGGGINSSKVDAYDNSLTCSTPTALSVARRNLGATTTGDYALFGGGLTVSTNSAAVDAYDKSLVRSTPTTLSVARNSIGAATVGGHALFGGGYTGNTSVAVVDAYDNSLTRSTPTALSAARSGNGAATVGGHALFGGGGLTVSTNSAVVDAYDKSLVRSTPTALSVARRNLGATTTGDYALFGGGLTGNASVAVVDAYNVSLTRSTPTALSVARSGMGATAVGDYALFGGGAAGNDSKNLTYYAVVDAYDTSLTRSFPATLKPARDGLAATTVGTYALFGGGYTSYNGSSYTYSRVVEAFEYKK